MHHDIPRTKWKMAVVEQLVQGTDGHVRAANIRYGERKKTNKPIAKLYPLEVSSNSNKDVTETEVSTISTATNDESASLVQPATKAWQSISNWTRMLLSPAPEDVEDLDD